MAAFLLYLLALILVVGSWFLHRRTSPYSRIGGDAYERKRLRKVASFILFIAGLMVLTVAILTQCYPRVESEDSPPSSTAQTASETHN